MLTEGTYAAKIMTLQMSGRRDRDSEINALIDLIAKYIKEDGWGVRVAITFALFTLISFDIGI